MLYPNFKKYVSEKGLIAKGDKILVSVSGGMDSMVLLDLTLRLAHSWDFEIAAAHVNHRLRGRESDADEELVKNTAKRYGIECHIRRAKPSAGKNVQNAARDIRLTFLKEAGIGVGASSIATAHHMDDQTETVLLHLIRGAGLKGLAGIRASSNFGDLKIIRPLLFTSRKGIEEYAGEREIEFREDRTNLKTDYTRNSVRHRLLPLLAEFNPRISQHISKTASGIADDDDLLEIIAHEAFQDIRVDDGTRSITLSSDSFSELPKSLRLRVLRRAFKESSGSHKDLNSDQLSRMDHIALSSNRNGAYRLPSKLRFERKGDLLTFKICKTRCDRKN